MRIIMIMIARIVFFYCCIGLLFPSSILASIDHDTVHEETRLLRLLLDQTSYSKKVRPSQTVTVDFRLVFNQIISMVEKEQIIVTNCFVDQKWTDPRLVWNPGDFRNLTWIRMPASQIWYPDTFLYNTADNAGFLLPHDSQNVIVSFNGTVFWPLPLAQLRTRCRMTIKHFPFDEQSCEMIFGSWSHTSQLIRYRFWEITPEIPQYTPNNEWKLLAVNQSIKTIDYPNWVEPYLFYEVNFTILIVRKPLQAIYNTVVPALMLTILTLVSFFIPFAQEMQIGISIMLAYSVFSLRLSEDVPSQSDSVHLISLYLTVCMCFSLLAMTWFALSNKLREKKRLPYWLRWLALDYVSWIVFAKSMKRKAVRAVAQQQQQQQKTVSISVPMAPTPPSATTFPLQRMTANQIEFSNSYYSERDSLPASAAAKVPLLPSKSEQSLRPSIMSAPSVTSTIDEPAVAAAVAATTTATLPTTVWIRRGLSNLGSSSNGPNSGKTNRNPATTPRSRLAKLHDRTLTKDKESLYAISIYNRLVFLMFCLTVIIINIYTWFFYSRSLKTKLLDGTVWICFDEILLQVVNCSNTT